MSQKHGARGASYGTGSGCNGRQTVFEDEVRGILAAYMADEYLLGQEDEGWRHLNAALRRGDLGPGHGLDELWPVGRTYIRKLRSFLEQSGYAS